MDSQDELLNRILNERDNRLVDNANSQLEQIYQAAFQQRQEEEEGGNEETQSQESDVKEQLVDIIQSYPVLWSTSSRSFKDLIKKEAAWKDISNKLKVSSKYYFIC